MPILLIFALAAACFPVKWQAPLFGGWHEVAITFASTAVGCSLFAAIVLRTWVVRTLRREPIRKGEVASVYSRLRRLMFFGNIGLVALSILVFGWGEFVRTTFVYEGEVDPFGDPLLMPFAELAVPLPYFAILFGAWLIYFDAERALHRTTVLGPVNRPFWSRVGYFLHHLRQFALMVMLPVGLVVAMQTIARCAPETSQANWYRLGSLGLLPFMILIMPMLIKPLLGLQSMPPGPVRDRLEALAKRLHFRCTDFLLWPTHGATTNAMIVGLFPRVRYVIFTDRILDELPPEETDAVFGHEVGHAKHGHMLLYALFLMLSMVMLAALFLFVENWMKDWIELPPLLLMAVYIFLVWGYLSRRCERQADVYGCRAVSCANPNCTGHDAQTIYPERARGLCATGIRTFVNALERVDYIHCQTISDKELPRSFGETLKDFFAWLRAWQHSTMSRRVVFLRSLIGHPEKERRFQRSVSRLRWILILGLLAALYVLGDEVGWQKLLKEL